MKKDFQMILMLLEICSKSNHSIVLPIVVICFCFQPICPMFQPEILMSALWHMASPLRKPVALPALMNSISLRPKPMYFTAGAE